MSIKLIALDLDNTTLNSQGKLSDTTKEALEKAMSKGVKVVIATGRCFSALPDFIKNLKGMEYIATSNGALIRDLKTDQNIYRNCIDEKAIPQIEKTLRNNSNMIEVFVDGKAYIERKQYDDVKNGKVTHRHSYYVLETRNPKENLMAFMLENREKIENINIFFEDPDEKAEMYPILMALKDVTITSSLDNNWEIGGKTTSKADAIRHLCGIWGFKKEEVMACGDSPNDESMMKDAGISVAVANAKESVKKVAMYMVASNNDDGVAEAIHKYVEL